MGISFSCPFAEHADEEGGMDSVIVRSVCFGDDQVKTPVQSISFNRRDMEPTISKSLGSGKMALETSVSVKGIDFEKMVSVKVPSLDKEQSMSIVSMDSIWKEIKDEVRSKKLDSAAELIEPSISGAITDRHMAAVKLQKVYKSFRTRRKLADCAVLVEQSWWKLLDFAELKRSSISFFEIEKHETAISRWSRARTRAAKVGKGLSKNDKAQKLALQHWLEAIDPRHRYGHNLHFYYNKWLHCQSREPFFYWLDIGEGKEVNLDKCPRSKLQQQCIKYLGPRERMAYEVVVLNGKFFYKQSGELLHTTSEGKDAKWIFVLSTSKMMYVGKKKKGKFQHSSFLAGGATTAAGRLVVENGVLRAVWPHSGHYRPTEQNFKDFISFLEENYVDLRDVQMSPVDEEDDAFGKQLSSLHVRNNSSDEDLAENLGGLETEEIQDAEETNVEDLTPEKSGSAGKAAAAATPELHSPKRSFSIGKNLTNLEIPKREKLLERLESENEASSIHLESSVEGHDTAEVEFQTSDQGYMILKNSSDQNDEENEIEAIPEESILKRINSRKGMNSYQLGKQLSCKWTTGAGPRIGCVRDYPSELQFRALEKVNLSPRSKTGRSRSHVSPRIIYGSSPKVLMPANSGDEMAENSSSRSSLSSMAQPSPLIRGVSATIIR